MPEGDTVWHTATILRDALAGKTLTRCDVRVPKYATVDLTGQVVDEVISRGKHLFIRVGQASIHSHLKMDGSWKVNPISLPSRAGYRIRIILETGDIQAAGIDLGVLEVLERDHDMDVVAHLGPDLLGDDWDPHVAATNLTSRPEPAAIQALLDQRVMAGVGNVYCNELCFVTGHLPTAPSRTSRTRCGWCSGPVTCCGSTGLDGTARQRAIPDPAATCGSTVGAVSRADAAARRWSQTTAGTASPTGAPRVSGRERIVSGPAKKANRSPATSVRTSVLPMPRRPPTPSL